MNQKYYYLNNISYEYLAFGVRNCLNEEHSTSEKLSEYAAFEIFVVNVVLHNDNINRWTFGRSERQHGQYDVERLLRC